MTKYSGYAGRVCEIDLYSKQVREYPWSDKEREMYLGGKAMASKILYDNFTGGENPLGGNNIIVISTGPLTGTNAPSSNRFNISALSPLTGITTSSNSGGNFGYYLKKSGIDALIIRGKCKSPTWIEISDGNINFHDASGIWGLKVSEAQEALQKKMDELHGKKVRCGMAVIGPAGENLVRYACVISGERASGRGGTGAVFGSKNIKGLVSTGDYKITVHNAEKVAALNKKWINSLKSHPITGNQLPRLGTASLVSPMQMSGMLATRNFSEGRFEDFELVSGEALAEEENVSNNGCLSCPIRCSRVVMVDGKKVKGPELETLGLMGPNQGINDVNAVCRWNYEIDELGMDSISTAGTLAWAMEANQKGLWKNGLEFGKPDNISAVLDDIAHRRGVGNELAEGSRILSQKYGGEDFAIQSKGMELSAYEPRRAVGQGLGYAVSNRGGCHLNGGYLVILEGLGLRANAQTRFGKPDLCMFMQNFMEAISSSGQCLFTSFSVFPALLVNKPNGIITSIVNAVIPLAGPVVRILNWFPLLACINLPLIPHTYEIKYALGMRMTIGKFLRIGDRSYNIERALNAKFGVSAEDDTLPKRLTDEMQEEGKKNTVVPLERMKKTYYRARGWSSKGLPGWLKLRLLGIRK
ncbi:MAG: aldehyde ferredoxin oxidoreductase family protein [Ruminococcaceae bacterium]|nr:aldehyde ferredoxin oxidoreductase family protein [Oscillospiraceae bacterium]